MPYEKNAKKKICSFLKADDIPTGEIDNLLQIIGEPNYDTMSLRDIMATASTARDCYYATRKMISLLQNVWAEKDLVEIKIGGQTLIMLNGFTRES